MKNPLPFPFRPAWSREILTQHLPFLPVGPAPAAADGAISHPEMPPGAGFLPAFGFNPKNSTLAQPLLKEACDELR
jgi:hypothetical protein